MTTEQPDLAVGPWDTISYGGTPVPPGPTIGPGGTITPPGSATPPPDGST